MQLQLVWVDVVLHKIFPIIVVVDWLVDSPRTRLAMRDIGVLIVYPLIWTALTMVRGAADPAQWYPYPFLDPKNGGYGQVLITAIAVTIGFVVISAAIIWLGNWRRGLDRGGRPDRAAVGGGGVGGRGAGDSRNRCDSEPQREANSRIPGSVSASRPGRASWPARRGPPEANRRTSRHPICGEPPGPGAAGPARMPTGGTRYAASRPGRAPLARRPRRRRPLVQRHRLPPVRDLRREAERPDLWLDRDLRLGIAVDEEHIWGSPPRPAALPSAKWPTQARSSRLVGVGAEPADRADPAADLAVLAVELDDLRPGLEVGAERALALVADEQEGRRPDRRSGSGDGRAPDRR